MAKAVEDSRAERAEHERQLKDLESQTEHDKDRHAEVGRFRSQSFKQTQRHLLPLLAA